MKRILIISLLCATYTVFGMNDSSTNVAHLVEVPSTNSLMYQKFNSISARTLIEQAISPYTTNNSANLVHCYDALLNRTFKINDTTYCYHDNDSIIWNDLIGTGDLVLSSDNIAFTDNSVKLSADPSCTYRTNGLIVSSMCYNDFKSEAVKKHTDVIPWITVEICVLPDTDLTLANRENLYSAPGRYPDRHTLFNLGVRNNKVGTPFAIMTQADTPIYFTIDNDTNGKFYLNSYKEPQFSFSTLYGYNAYYNTDSIFHYRGLVNKYSIYNDYISPNGADFITNLYNAASLSGGEPDNYSKFPPMTIVYWCSFTNKTVVSDTSVTNNSIRLDSFSIFPHLRQAKDIETYPEISISNRLIRCSNAMNGLEWKDWTRSDLFTSQSNPDISYASFGGSYRAGSNIYQGEFFYGHIYSIRIYYTKDESEAYSRRKDNILIDRRRFFSDLDAMLPLY